MIITIELLFYSNSIKLVPSFSIAILNYIWILLPIVFNSDLVTVCRIKTILKISPFPLFTFMRKKKLGSALSWHFRM